MTAPRDARLGSEDDGGLRFWICAAVGLGVVAFAVNGLLHARFVGSVGSWATYLFGGLIAHDAVLAPLVVVTSVVLLYVVPSRIRPAVQGTLIVAGSVLLVAVPVLAGRGRIAGNPSLLPRDYAAGIAIALSVVVLAGVVAAVRAARRPPPPPLHRRPGGW